MCCGDLIFKIFNTTMHCLKKLEACGQMNGSYVGGSDDDNDDKLYLLNTLYVRHCLKHWNTFSFNCYNNFMRLPICQMRKPRLMQLIQLVHNGMGFGPRSL